MGSEETKASNLLQKGDDNDEDKGGSGLSDILGAAKSGLKGAKAAIMKKAEAAKSGLKEAGAAIMKKGEAAIKSKVDEKLLQKHQGSEDKKVSNLLQKGDDNDEDKGGSGLSDIVEAAKSGLKEAGAAIMKKAEEAKS